MMGSALSREWRALMHENEANVKGVLILGLDFAGKSTILKQLNLGTIQTITPFPYYTFETVRYRDVQFTSWDIGGRMHKTILKTWDTYFENAIGVIWVVDSNDRDRIVEVKEELHRQILGREQLEGVPLCVLANKQDVSGVLTAEEVAEKLQLGEKLGSDAEKGSRPWHIQGASATNGWGFLEGVEWLDSALGGALRLPWHEDKSLVGKIRKLLG